MKNTIKRIATMMLVIVLALTAMSTQTLAAAKADLKKANVSWDLKPDKKVKFNTYYPGLEKNKKLSAVIKNYKITDAEKEGYKQLTFSLEMNWPVFTNKEVDKMNQHSQMYGLTGAGTAHYTLVDYTTGLSLEDGNDKGVTCTDTGFEIVKEKMYSSSEWMWSFPTKIVVETVTVTYPKDYKGLCLVVGGMTKKAITDPEPTAKFREGTGKISASAYVDKKDKTLIHAMRIK